MNAKANIDIVLITASPFIFPINNMISHLRRRAWELSAETNRKLQSHSCQKTALLTAL